MYERDTGAVRSLMIAVAIAVTVIIVAMAIDTFAPIWARMCFYFFCPLGTVMLVEAIKNGWFDSSADQAEPVLQNLDSNAVLTLKFAMAEAVPCPWSLIGGSCAASRHIKFFELVRKESLWDLKVYTIPNSRIR